MNESAGVWKKKNAVHKYFFMNDEVLKYIWRDDTCSLHPIRSILLQHKADNSLKRVKTVDSVILSLDALDSAVLTEREVGFFLGEVCSHLV